jgi:hypothetical protein
MAGDRGTRAGDDNPKIPGSSRKNGSSRRGTRVGDDQPSNFGWGSPRWREDAEPRQGAVEKERRDHDSAEPKNDPHGAIKRGVPGSDRPKRGGPKRRSR